MRVLFVAAEVAPLAKVGGLADVAAGLPRALRALGHDVRLMLPRHAGLVPVVRSLGLVFEARSDRGPERCELFEGDLHDVPLYLVGNERLLNRERIYGYQDDLDRYVFFSRAALEGVRALGWRPDLVHTHDWHTAIIPAWLHLTLRNDPFFGDAASVFTIHNLAFQGWFDEDFRRRFDVVPQQVVAVPRAGVDLHSTLALAVVYADAVNTVSETYAREILTPEYGEGVDALLRSRRDRLFGITNGIDYEVFDPATDTRIAARYSAADLSGKAVDKATLQREAGFPVVPDEMLVGMVSRLFDQKGLDLVQAALPELLAAGAFQMVLLGTGAERYERFFADLARRFPDRFAAYLTFDAALAERIYAGADLFLMPSRFEPCGLGQLIALRYGTVPLVRATGGLVDTVADLDERGDHGTGFVFREYTPEALRRTLLRASEVFRQPEVWQGLVRRGMQRDLSWTASAKQYERLYADAVDYHSREPR